MNPSAFLDWYYPEDTPLRCLLIRHSTQVRDKAISILSQSPREVMSHVDVKLVIVGAMLHDIGIRRCSAPSILCMGKEPYLAHGVIGAEMIRSYAEQTGISGWEKVARICECHTGSGLTAQEIRKTGITSIPERDYLPESLEEKLVCLSDKFFSKSGDGGEKTVFAIRKSIQKFGQDALARMDELFCLFGIPIS